MGSIDKLTGQPAGIWGVALKYQSFRIQMKDN